MMLARGLDERIEELRTKHGEIGDTRLTIMAALTLADELAEMNQRIRRLEQEIAGLQEGRVAAADRSKIAQAAIAAALNAAAERIEGITRKLNQTVPVVLTRSTIVRTRASSLSMPPSLFVGALR